MFYHLSQPPRQYIQKRNPSRRPGQTVQNHIMCECHFVIRCENAIRVSNTAILELVYGLR